MKLRLVTIADRIPNQDVLEFIQLHQPDVICLLGDLDIFIVRPLRQVTDIPIVGVYGNHCHRGYLDDIGATDLHLKTIDIKGVKFGGFEGSVRYKNNPDAPMLTQEEANELVEALPPVEVLISHCPPYGVHDEPNETDKSHEGFRALRHYDEIFKPKYHLHGHTYPCSDKCSTMLGQTEVIFTQNIQAFEIGL